MNRNRHRPARHRLQASALRGCRADESVPLCWPMQPDARALSQSADRCTEFPTRWNRPRSERCDRPKRTGMNGRRATQFSKGHSMLAQSEWADFLVGRRLNRLGHGIAANKDQQRRRKLLEQEMPPQGGVFASCFEQLKSRVNEACEDKDGQGKESGFDQIGRTGVAP